MEVSALPPMPLDFSMVRSGSGSPGNGLREDSPRPVTNSAFRVVTPKGMKFNLNIIRILSKKKYIIGKLLYKFIIHKLF